jgi:hypothetical protein
LTTKFLRHLMAACAAINMVISAYFASEECYYFASFSAFFAALCVCLGLWYKHLTKLHGSDILEWIDVRTTGQVNPGEAEEI